MCEIWSFFFSFSRFLDLIWKLGSKSGFRSASSCKVWSGSASNNNPNPDPDQIIICIRFRIRIHNKVISPSGYASKLCGSTTSVVDPVRTKTVGQIRIRSRIRNKSFRIRIRAALHLVNSKSFCCLFLKCLDMQNLLNRLYLYCRRTVAKRELLSL
jgi:hypothetical protein